MRLVTNKIYRSLSCPLLFQNMTTSSYLLIQFSNNVRTKIRAIDTDAAFLSITFIFAANARNRVISPSGRNFDEMCISDLFSFRNSEFRSSAGLERTVVSVECSCGQLDGLASGEWPVERLDDCRLVSGGWQAASSPTTNPRRGPPSVADSAAVKYRRGVTDIQCRPTRPHDRYHCRRSTPILHLLRSVADSLYNVPYDKSATNRKSAPNPQQVVGACKKYALKSKADNKSRTP